MEEIAMNKKLSSVFGAIGVGYRFQLYLYLRKAASPLDLGSLQLLQSQERNTHGYVNGAPLAGENMG